MQDQHREEGSVIEVKVRRPKSEQSVAMVICKGEANLYNAPLLKQIFIKLIEVHDCKHIIADIKGLTFIDSTTLGILLGSLKKLREKSGDLVLICHESEVRKLFRITQLDTIFSIFDSRKTAIETISSDLPAFRQWHTEKIMRVEEDDESDKTLEVKSYRPEGRPDTIVTTCIGQIHIHTAALLKKMLNEGINDPECRVFIIDLKKVSCMDSIGFAILLRVLKKTQSREGSVNLVGPNVAITRMLKILMLDTVFSHYDTVEEALAATE